MPANVRLKNQELVALRASHELFSHIKQSVNGSDIAESALLEGIHLRHVAHTVLLVTNSAKSIVSKLMQQSEFGVVECYYVEKSRLWLYVRPSKAGQMDGFTGWLIGNSESGSRVYYTRYESRRIDDISRSYRVIRALENNDAKNTTITSELSGLISIINSPRLSQFDKRSIVNRIIAPIWKDKVMLRTIEALFGANLNISQAAKKLNVHRNTLIYRLRRVEDMTGVNLMNFYEAKQLYLCWLAKNII